MAYGSLYNKLSMLTAEVRGDYFFADNSQTGEKKKKKKKKQTNNKRTSDPSCSDHGLKLIENAQNSKVTYFAVLRMCAF